MEKDDTSHPLQQSHLNYLQTCPVCENAEFEFLSPVWKNYHRELEFALKKDEWFVECRRCGTIARFPLIDYGEQFKKYGEDYYNQGQVDGSVDDHAEVHFNHFQKGNYDSIRELLRELVPPSTHPRWLDVGSVGYATTFSDYDFTTIEPDERVVKVGRRLFGSSPRWFRPKIFAATIDTYATTEKFDGILFNNSYYCVTAPAHAAAKARQLLKPDGRLVITISTRLNGAVQNRDDGLISRIEDVLVGETLWVFYNEMSLRYLLAANGFELESTQEIAAYGRKTMIAYVFKPNDHVVPDVTWLDQSRRHMQRTMQDVYEEFEQQTESTLRIINQPKTILVGPLQVLSDLSRRGSLDQVAAVFCTDAVLEGVTDGNLKFMSWSNVLGLTQQQPKDYYHFVICSFREQAQLWQFLRKELGQESLISMPNRRSGIDAMELIIGGRLVPVKGFKLTEQP